jgi:hypothetical protein
MIDGEKVKQGRDFRCGYRKTVKGGDLIAWMRVESTKPVKISLIPVWYISR